LVLYEKLKACSAVWNGKNLMKLFISKQVPKRIINPAYLDSTLQKVNSNKVKGCPIFGIEAAFLDFARFFSDLFNFKDLR
jgi:hypothetical protein